MKRFLDFYCRILGSSKDQKPRPQVLGDLDSFSGATSAAGQGLRRRALRSAAAGLSYGRTSRGTTH